MSKKNSKKESVEVEDMRLLPELFDGKHKVVPIVMNDCDTIGEVPLFSSCVTQITEYSQAI